MGKVLEATQRLGGSESQSSQSLGRVSEVWPNQNGNNLPPLSHFESSSLTLNLCKSVFKVHGKAIVQHSIPKRIQKVTVVRKQVF